MERLGSDICVLEVLTSMRKSSGKILGGYVELSRDFIIIKY